MVTHERHRGRLVDERRRDRVGAERARDERLVGVGTDRVVDRVDERADRGAVVLDLDESEDVGVDRGDRADDLRLLAVELLLVVRAAARRVPIDVK